MQENQELPIELLKQLSGSKELLCQKIDRDIEKLNEQIKQLNWRKGFFLKHFSKVFGELVEEKV